MSQPAGSTDNRPVVIYVEDQYTDDGESFNYFHYVGKIIEACGFRVVHAKNHDVLPQVLEQHPEAVGIVSDVDTTQLGKDGLRWAETYVKNKDAKPFILISIVPNYRPPAEALGVCFLEKPFFLANDTLLTPRTHEIKFKKNLTKWLKDLAKNREQSSLLPDTHRAQTDGRFR